MQVMLVRLMSKGEYLIVPNEKERNSQGRVN